MAIINSTHTIHTIDTEEKLAALEAQVAEMNADEDDDWTYTIIPNPDKDGAPTAIIAIHDEDDEFVSYL